MPPVMQELHNIGVWEHREVSQYLAFPGEMWTFALVEKYFEGVGACFRVLMESGYFSRPPMTRRRFTRQHSGNTYLLAARTKYLPHSPLAKKISVSVEGECEAEPGNVHLLYAVIIHV
jgi:hypothetical protein